MATSNGGDGGRGRDCGIRMDRDGDIETLMIITTVIIHRGRSIIIVVVVVVPAAVEIGPRG